MYVGWSIWDGEHEPWRSQSFTWRDWDADGSPKQCLWLSRACVIMWHLPYFVWFLIHSLLHLLVVWDIFSCAHLLPWHVLYLLYVASCFLMRVKFARISFHDEFGERSSLMDLIIVHMVLVQKRERSFYVTMPWSRPMFASSWCTSPMLIWASVGWFLPYFERWCFDGRRFCYCWTLLVSFHGSWNFLYWEIILSWFFHAPMVFTSIWIVNLFLSF